MSIVTTETLRPDPADIYLPEKYSYLDQVPEEQHERPQHTFIKHRGFRSSNRVLNVISNILTPSFFRSWKEATTRPNASLMALDGLRGLACLAVVNQREFHFL